MWQMVLYPWYDFHMKEYVVGIDEVGRGPIAGPVTIGIVVISKKHYTKLLHTELYGVKDSKKLSAIQRKVWEKKCNALQKEGILSYTILSGNQKEIDTKGIAVVIRSLIKKGLTKYTYKKMHILLDGGLRAPEEYSQETIIKGDSIHPIISLASILAKEHRDRYMHRMDMKYKGYGFITHVGYGTKKHYEAIDRLGLCVLHRKSFLRGY